MYVHYLHITTLYIHIYTYRIRYLHVTILHIHTCHYLAFILATYFQMCREEWMRVAAAGGLRHLPLYRTGCGFAAMPGNRVLFPVANIQYTGSLPVTRTQL